MFGAACPTCGALMRLRWCGRRRRSICWRRFVGRRGAHQARTRLLEPEGRDSAETGPAMCASVRRWTRIWAWRRPAAHRNEREWASKPPPKWPVHQRSAGRPTGRAVKCSLSSPDEVLFRDLAGRDEPPAVLRHAPDAPAPRCRRRRRSGTPSTRSRRPPRTGCRTAPPRRCR